MPLLQIEHYPGLSQHVCGGPMSTCMWRVYTECFRLMSIVDHIYDNNPDLALTNYY